MTEADLIDWVLHYATAHDDLGKMLDGLCERLVATGIPVWRASLSLPTIDPSARAVSHIWRRNRSTSVERTPHGREQEAAFRKSVIYHLQQNNVRARRWRLEQGEGISEFELLSALHAEGATDYLLRLVGFGDGETALAGVAMSISTDRSGGFTTEEIETINNLTPAVGLATYRIAVARTATDALSVYLGPRTARRVLLGEVRRGEGQTIAAAILWADLKGFTTLSENEDALRVVGWLNEHFEVIGDAVMAQGGEILKFLGDGLLAVFPVADIEALPCPVCEQAVQAAREAVAANGTLNEQREARGEPRLDVDIALHFGEVVYGNVGAMHRLDFTVIGRAVNETSRMEALCDRLGRNILLSDALARRCSSPAIPLGSFQLRSIAGERIIHGLADESPRDVRARLR